jgi:hypothetical protein
MIFPRNHVAAKSLRNVSRNYHCRCPFTFHTDSRVRCAATGSLFVIEGSYFWLTSEPRKWCAHPRGLFYNTLELCGNALLFAKYGLIFPVGGTSRQEVHKVRKKIPSWAPLPSRSTVNKGFYPFWGAMIPSSPGPTPLAAPHHP